MNESLLLMMRKKMYMTLITAEEICFKKNSVSSVGKSVNMHLMELGKMGEEGCGILEIDR